MNKQDFQVYTLYNTDSSLREEINTSYNDKDDGKKKNLRKLII